MTIKPTAEEMERARAWFDRRFEPAEPGNLPFSFVYDGRPSSELLATWQVKRAQRRLDDGRAEQTVTITDPQTGLEVRCVTVISLDTPAGEWTVYFRNTGQADTPILSDILPLDIRLTRPALQNGKGEFTLHHIKGDSNTPDSYQPLDSVLGRGAEQRFAPVGGRPTNGAFPYFNLEWSGQGLILAIGWPGQWSARFVRDADAGLHICGGQELTHFRLRPGEEVRSPLVVLMFWNGDQVRAQNLWRRWMFAHVLPQPGGKPPKPLAVVCAEGFYDFTDGPDEMRQLLDLYLAQNLPVDLFWRDAGWYPCHHWTETGTWETDPKRFPNGFKPFSDYVHSKGRQFIVWFEPERVAPGTWLYENRPEWLLDYTPDGPDPRSPEHRWRLLDLGNAEARAWITEQLDRIMVEGGIDHYRQDFNMDPLPYWRENDARLSPTEHDRQGITENAYVTGYLAYWDELLRRHPGMMIDSCASGGRRNDLETLRRALPLLRSDYQSFTGDPDFAIGNQGHTYGLSQWIPYYGQGVYYGPQIEYVALSHLSPLFSIGCDLRHSEEIDWALVRRLMDEWKQVAGYMLGDFYPLTPYSLDKRDWMAWQFDRPETGEGFVQAFRRERSPYLSARFPLQGLDPQADYEIVALGAPDSRSSLPGSVLLQEGLPVTLAQSPQVRIYIYRRINKSDKG